MPVTFGCSVPSRGPLASPQALRLLAQRAEDLGFDSVWVSDHIILPRQVDSFYPYASDGVAVFRPDEPYYEPLSTLNFLAGCTQRLRLGTHVLIIPYRNPVLTAKILATLDTLSEGRVILGVGVGWMKEEFEALGLDTFHDRGAVTNEYLQLFKELWTEENPDFQGEYFQLSGSGFLPKPAQQPHPPIWIGGHTSPALRRAAQLGDGWMPIGLRPPAILEPEELSAKIAQLRRYTVRAGRPEEAVTPCFSTNIEFDSNPGPTRRMMSGRPEQIAADLRQYQDVGVRNFILGFT
ncbi:MAG: LLM class F420-dependent oxidoreductase, partial [Dehalococcoidia bacterium]